MNVSQSLHYFSEELPLVVSQSQCSGVYQLSECLIGTVFHLQEEEEEEEEEEGEEEVGEEEETEKEGEDDIKAAISHLYMQDLSLSVLFSPSPHPPPSPPPLSHLTLFLFFLLLKIHTAHCFIYL